MWESETIGETRNEPAFRSYFGLHRRARPVEASLSMRAAPLIGICVIVLAAWIVGGRRFTRLLDRFITLDAQHIPVTSMQYDGGGMRLNGLTLTFASTNNLLGDIKVFADRKLSADRAGHAVLLANGQQFTLGPCTAGPDPSGRPELAFVADSDDQISILSSRSLLSWPTWFEFQILGGRSPWWRRYVYYELLWKKSEGHTLEMRWRYEQQYYSGTGWTEPNMMWNSDTGLVSLQMG